MTPSVDGQGTFVAYASDCDPVGLNSDRSWEIFRVRFDGSVLQLTDDTTASACGSFDPQITSDARYVVFDSDCDLAGENPDHIVELFRVDKRKDVIQLTSSHDDSCENIEPRLAGDDGIVFESTCDFTGANGDGSPEIFRRTASGSVEQLTDDPSGTCESGNPATAAGGAAVAYVSSCDPFGMNSDGGFEVFQTDGNSLTQVTTGATCDSVAAAMDAAGRVTFLVSDCDLVGQNPDGSHEIFAYADCACGAPASRFANGSVPTTTDALMILQGAVGLTTCPLCECDVDSDLATTATDALMVLSQAVGQSVALMCPL